MGYRLDARPSVARAVCAVMLASVAWVGGAHANAIYTYTGNAFTTYLQTGSAAPYPQPSNVSGIVELASPLAGNLTLATVTPLVLSFSDGTHTFSESDTLNQFKFSTDASGNVIDWLISIQDLTHMGPGGTVYDLFSGSVADLGDLLICSSANAVGACNSTEAAFGGGFAEGFVQHQPGHWTSPVRALPEPGTVSLLVLAMTGSGLVLRRQRQPRMA